jgi:hypothetical protein
MACDFPGCLMPGEKKPQRGAYFLCKWRSFEHELAASPSSRYASKCRKNRIKRAARAIGAA